MGKLLHHFGTISEPKKKKEKTNKNLNLNLSDASHTTLIHQSNTLPCEV